MIGHEVSDNVLCQVQPSFSFTDANAGPQRVSFDPRPSPRVFKGLHGSNVKAIINP